MPENSSCGDPLLHPNFSTGYTDLPFSICYILRPFSYVYCLFFILNILLLTPLYTCVLYVGLKRRQKCSTTMSGMSTHLDFFTYHTVTMELIGVIGYIICCCGNLALHVQTYWVGYCLSSVPWYGGLIFHTLTCVERYLAVVHPIIYITLRTEKATTVRNIGFGIVWLLTIGMVCLLASENISGTIDIALLTLCIIIISLCSSSVLWVLIHPGPGEQSAGKEKVDQSKKRAFITIVAILVVLFLRCIWSLIWTSVLVLKINPCAIMSFGVWFNIPSALVLPLLFLQRVGMLSCCRKSK